MLLSVFQLRSRCLYGLQAAQLVCRLSAGFETQSPQKKHFRVVPVIIFHWHNWCARWLQTERYVKPAGVNGTAQCEWYNALLW
jgi:hypothetical protein